MATSEAKTRKVKKNNFGVHRMLEPEEEYNLKGAMQPR